MHGAIAYAIFGGTEILRLWPPFGRPTLPMFVRLKLPSIMIHFPTGQYSPLLMFSYPTRPFTHYLDQDKGHTRKRTLYNAKGFPWLPETSISQAYDKVPEMSVVIHSFTYGRCGNLTKQVHRDFRITFSH
jgi:hypothetical protein